MRAAIRTLFSRRDTDSTLIQPIRFSAGARARMQGTANCAHDLCRASFAVTLLVSLLAAPLMAQRVAFPTPVQPVQNTYPYTAPATPAPYVAPAAPYSAAPAPT